VNFWSLWTCYIVNLWSLLYCELYIEVFLYWYVYRLYFRFRPLPVYFPYWTFVSDVSEIPMSFPFPELPFSVSFPIKKTENRNSFSVYRLFPTVFIPTKHMPFLSSPWHPNLRVIWIVFLRFLMSFFVVFCLHFSCFRHLIHPSATFCGLLSLYACVVKSNVNMHSLTLG
jgi:hypothetical protein